METTSLRNRSAWQVVAGRIARFFGIHIYDLYYGEKGLLSPLEPVVPSPPTEVRLATPEDLNRIICSIGGTTRRKFDHNIAVYSCHAAFHEGTITGYLWVNRQVIDMKGMYVAKLPPKSSLVRNVFVLPEHRRKRIFRYLFRAVCNEMHKAGFLSITCLIDKANSQSVEAFKNEGFEFHNAAVLKLPRIKPILFCRALA